MIRLGADTARRKPNLTPMIDVVFFTLASRFGAYRAVPVSVAGTGGRLFRPAAAGRTGGRWDSSERHRIPQAGLSEALKSLTTPLFCARATGQICRPLLVLWAGLPPQGFPVWVWWDRDGFQHTPPTAQG